MPQLLFLRQELKIVLPIGQLFDDFVLILQA